MKFRTVLFLPLLMMSRPARGAWVEINNAATFEWVVTGRAPQGARGLKYNDIETKVNAAESRPARGAWVEISQSLGATRNPAVAPRKGRVG